MLRSINLSLSSVCTGNCLFCPTDRGELSTKKFMAYADAVKIIDEIADSELKDTVKKIEVSENGDPLMNKDFVPILRHIKRRLPNVLVNLFTNFYLLNEELANTLLSERLVGHVCCNIDSTDKEYYKIMKGLNLDVVFPNLQNFVKLRNELYPELPMLINIIGLKNYVDTVHERLGTAPMKLVEKDQIYQEDALATKQELERILELKSIDSVNISGVMLWAERASVTSAHRKGKCVNLGRIINEAFIAPDGSWYACCFDSKTQLKFGNVLASSIREVNNSIVRSEFIRLLKLEEFDKIGYPCNTSICCEISPHKIRGD